MKPSQKLGFLRLLVLIIVAISAGVGIFFFTDIGVFSLSGETISKETALDKYDKITFKGSGTIEIRNGTTRSVAVTTDKTLYKKINIKEKKGLVEVSFNNLDLVRSFKLKKEDIVYLITTPDLTSIETSGSFAIVSKDEISGNEISIDTKGQTELNLNLYANNLDITSSGHGNLSLEGTVLESTSLTANGAGRFDFKKTNINTMDIQATGSNVFELNDPFELSLRLTGTNQVTFKEAPILKQAKTQGQSTIGLEANISKQNNE